MLPLSYTVRELRRRPGRTALALMGIVIGVAAIVGISVALETSRGAYREMFGELTGRAALEVVAQGYGLFDAEVMSDLEALPGIEAVVPVLVKPTALLGAAGAVPVLAMGVDPVRDRAARRYHLRAGAGFQTGEGLLLEAGFAEANGFALGESVRFLTPAGLAELPVVGLLEPKGAATFNGGSVVFMPLAAAQRTFAAGDRINAVQLVLEEGASVPEIESALRARLPVGLIVQTPASRGALAKATMHGTELGLAVLSVVSLVAGAFVILNSFLMSIAERKRELAILRSLGATRRQVTRLLMREAAILGVMGTVVGIPLGLAAAAVLTHIIGEMLGITLPAVRITASPILAAVLLGPGVALAATYLPARQAGRRAPLEGLRESSRGGEQRLPLWPSYLGLSILALVGLFVVAIVRGWVPLSVAVSALPGGMGMMCVAVVLVLPLFLPPLARAVGVLLRIVLQVEGGLAARQLLRHSTRTGLTVGVLTIAIMVSIGYGNSMLNSVRDIRTWSRRIGDVDFFIRGSLPDPGTMSLVIDLPKDLREEIRAIEGVEAVDRINFVVSRVGGQPVVILAQDFSSGMPLRLDLETPNASEVRDRLRNGEVIVGTTLAQRMEVGVGDEIVVPTRAGPTALRIAGLTTEYSAGGLSLGMDWEAAERLLGLDGVHVFGVAARPGSLADVTQVLGQLCRERGLMLQSRAQFQEMIEEAIAGVVGSSWVVMAMVFVVASLGIANTLTMNVLEQTREIGIMRALAMRRGQVRKMIMGQALGVALVSLAPGILGGIGMAYAMNLSTYALTGFVLEFHLEAALLSVTLVAALAIAGAAAYLPARRAAALPIIAALRYE